MVRGDRAEFVSVSQVVQGILRGLRRSAGARPAVRRLSTTSPADRRSPSSATRSGSGTFGANAEVVGSTIVIADKPLTVIGVMPGAFEATSPADVFVPLQA